MLSLLQAAGYASDDLDAEEQPDDAMDVDEEEEMEASSAKKRKLSKAAEAKLKAKEKKKKGKDDDDYDEDDAYTALSRSLRNNSASRPPIGSFENCAVCKKQFTVVRFYKLHLCITFLKPSRQNIPWRPALAKDIYVINVLKQAGLIHLRNLHFQRNAKRHRRRGTSLPLKNAGFLLLFPYVSKYVTTSLFTD